MKHALRTTLRSCLLCAASLPTFASGISTGSTALSLVIGPECSLTALSITPGSNAQKTQVLTFNYKVRTASTGGHGQVLVKFSGSNTFPNGSKVVYQTSLTGPGIAVSGNASIANAMNNGVVVATFGNHTSSTRTGGTGTVEFSVTPTPPSSYGPLSVIPSISCQ